MPDPFSMTNLTSLIAATGGLGSAAMGLVDTSKLFGGGPSNFGFGYIKDGLKPYLDALPSDSSAYGRETVLQTLRANWLNGVAKADQKAKAKSLIHLGLTQQGSTDQFAKAAGVNAATLKAAAANVAANQPVDPKGVNVLGQFDAALSGALDLAYERGDQKYRNASKFLAMVVAIVLGGAAGKIVFGDEQHVALCLLLGVIATPLAPASKDVVTALQGAVASIGKLKS